jgi:hypothetical protein
MLPIYRAVVACSLVLALSPYASAQGKGSEKPAARAEPAQEPARRVYTVRGPAPKELAAAVQELFGAEGGFHVAVDSGTNVLLLKGPAPLLDEVTAVLQEIDRPARAVQVEVILVELVSKADGAGDGTAFEPPDLAGAERELADKIRDLQKQGTVSSVRRVQLTTLEKHVARAQAGANKPSATGVTSVAGRGDAAPAPGGRGGDPLAQPGGGGRPGAGVMSRSYTYQRVGTAVQAKPEIAVDGVVTLELQVEDARMQAAEGGAKPAAEERGASVSLPEILSTTLESRVSVRPGRVVLAQGAWTGSKTESGAMLVLVTARVEDLSPQRGK